MHGHGLYRKLGGYAQRVRNVLRIAASTLAASTGLGLAGLGAAAVAEAQPAPLPEYPWCPGQLWDPQWGDNWDQTAATTTTRDNGERQDQAHWASPPVR